MQLFHQVSSRPQLQLVCPSFDLVFPPFALISLAQSYVHISSLNSFHYYLFYYGFLDLVIHTLNLLTITQEDINT